MGVGLVVHQLKILINKLKNTFNFRIQPHTGKGFGGTGELLFGLLQMVEVEVGIAQSVDKCPTGEAANLGHHHGQKGIACNIEGNSQKDVGTSLVELATELPLCHMELDKSVAGGQGHFGEVGRIPGREDVPPGVGLFPQTFNQARNLVNFTSIRIFPMPPLMAIDRTEFPLFVGPLIPYTNFMLTEEFRYWSPPSKTTEAHG